MKGRTIVVGDIHGCYDELQDLLKKVALGADDRVVSVGDLVVKGPKNREVLDLFMNDPRFSAVLGNHDRALLLYWYGERVTLTESQRKCHKELSGGGPPDSARYSNYLRGLPLMIDLGSHIVVHAGLRPRVPLEEQTVEDLTELRTLGKNRKSRTGTPWYEVYKGKEIALFGHWPAPEPRRGPRAIGLDTGCVYGFQLTAYVVETGEFVSVPARRAYDLPRQQFAPAGISEVGLRTPPEPLTAVQKVVAQEPVLKETAPPAPSLKIFLCHSSEDKETIRDLYRRLREDGFEPWLDEEDLVPGQRWEREIKKAVKSSDVVLVCLSSTSISKTGYVQKEIKEILDVADYQPEDTIFLIPVKLEECLIPDRLSQWHWVNLSEARGYEKLIRALRARAGNLTRS